MTDRAIISCALTGALTTRSQCPAIPYTPVEIGEEARRAAEVGAAIVHIQSHDRDRIKHLSIFAFCRQATREEGLTPLLGAPSQPTLW